VQGDEVEFHIELSPLLPIEIGARLFREKRFQDLTEEMVREIVFKDCLDDFSDQFGYLVDHLVKIKRPAVVYVENREYFTLCVQQILNPLNCNTFGLFFAEGGREGGSLCRPDPFAREAACCPS
jgi:hypothetical protein